MDSVSSLLFWPNKILAVQHQPRGQVPIMNEVLQPKHIEEQRGTMSTGITKGSSLQPILQGN